jgi:hypothetical protein
MTELALPLELPPHVESSARFSACGTYRYRLVRIWDSTAPVLCLVMLNPSKAGAWHNDRTIRRCIAFARSFGYGGIVVRNLYALVSTDPRALADHHDPIGPDNEAELALCCRHDLTVLAWGGDADPDRAHQVAARLWRDAQSAGTSLAVFGWTVTEQPRHPLYLSKNTPLECVTPSDFTDAHESEDRRWRHLTFGIAA